MTFTGHLNKKINFYFLILALFFFCGCIPMYFSIDPIYNSDSAVFNEKLLGDWVETNNDDSSLISITKKSEKEYLIKSITSLGQELYSVHLVELDDKYFLDFYGLPEKESNNLAIPVHYFEMVEFGNDEIALFYLNIEKLKEKKFHRYKDLFSLVDENNLLFTCSTDKLREFLKILSREKDAFTKSRVLKRLPAKQ